MKRLLAILCVVLVLSSCGGSGAAPVSADCGGFGKNDYELLLIADSSSCPFIAADASWEITQHGCDATVFLNFGLTDLSGWVDAAGVVHFDVPEDGATYACQCSIAAPAEPLVAQCATADGSQQCSFTSHTGIIIDR